MSAVKMVCIGVLFATASGATIFIRLHLNCDRLHKSETLSAHWFSNVRLSSLTALLSGYPASSLKARKNRSFSLKFPLIIWKHCFNTTVFGKRGQNVQDPDITYFSFMLLSLVFMHTPKTLMSFLQPSVTCPLRACSIMRILLVQWQFWWEHCAGRFATKKTE